MDEAEEPDRDAVRLFSLAVIAVQPPDRILPVMV